MSKNGKTFKVSVKDGDTKYTLNKSGQYVSKIVDYVEEFDSFAAALEVFAGYVVDTDNNEKVTLTINSNKKK